MTRHCHQCGWEWTFARPPGRTETCDRCRADLRACLNCRHYDAAAAQQCREPRAEAVAEKDHGTFCEWFEFARRVYTPGSGRDRTAAAREQFRKLFGG